MLPLQLTEISEFATPPTLKPANMDLPNSSEPNCTLFSVHQDRQLILVRGITAAICFTANLLTLAAIIFYQAWRNFLQRLFLYLTVGSLGVLYGFVLQIEHVSYSNHEQRPSCVAAAFFVQYFEWVVLLLLFCTSLSLLVQRLYLLRKTRRGYKLKRRDHLHKCYLWSAEGFLVIFSFTVPLPFSVVPFVHDTYGESGPWCWIRAVDHNCKTDGRGYAEQMGLWYGEAVPLGVLSLLFVVILAIVFLLWVRIDKPPLQNVCPELGRVSVLVLFIVLFTVFNLVGFGIRIHDYRNPTSRRFAVWTLYAITSPLNFLVPFLGFWIYYSCSVRELSVKEAVKRWTEKGCCKCTKNPETSMNTLAADKTCQVSIARPPIPSVTVYEPQKTPLNSSFEVTIARSCM